MEMETLQHLLGSYGFPVAVTAYLLWERKKLIEELQKSLSQVNVSLVQLTEAFKGANK